MVELIEANWIAVAVVLVLALLVVWRVWGRKSPAPLAREFNDVLSEGAAPAQRNTALIDTAPAAAIPPITPPAAAGILGGMGEVVAAAAEQEVEEAAVKADDLTRIKGLGPKLNARLAELGVTTYAQIAGWGEDDIKAIDAQLGSFAGRPVRDNWVEQAKLLAGDDAAAYEAKFGKL